MPNLAEDIQAAVNTLHNGGLIAYPTEAVYGLGCDPKNASALGKLITLKQRDQSKGLILIASKIEQLHEFINEDLFNLRPEIKKQWPGPVTWVIPCKNTALPLLTGGRATIAVRVSAHPVVQTLCNNFGGAIVSTSANISGEPPFKQADALQAYFGNSLTVVHAPVGDAKQVTSIFDASSGRQLR